MMAEVRSKMALRRCEIVEKEESQILQLMTVCTSRRILFLFYPAYGKNVPPASK